MKNGHRFTRLLFITLSGGVAVGVCFAAAVPGVVEIAGSGQYSGRVAPKLRPLDEPTTLYDANGDVLDVLGLKDRRPVELADIPKVLTDAIIATEDSSFYDNPGVDFSSMLRALWTNVEEGDVLQGGSTITQQLIKNRYFKNPRRDIDRKIKEAALALRLNKEWSKKRILEEYLNTVYFGQGSYGVKAAAERFFPGTPLDKVNLNQAALLAAVISNPEGYNPWKHPEEARARRAEVLRRMVRRNVITQTEADLSNLAALPTTLPPAELRADSYYADWVRELLLADPRLGATAAEREKRVFTGGLRVYTAFDPLLTLKAQSAVNETLPTGTPFTAAMAVMDPANGDVRAIVGGVGFDKQQCNLATNPPGCSLGGRQPGSTFKAVTLTSAIENGFSPNDNISGSSPCTIRVKGYAPYPTRNAGDGSGGTMTIRRATQNSVNCAYVRLNAAVGPTKTAEMAKRLGVGADRDIQPILSLPLGTQGVSPVDMATVYSTLAADGRRHDPRFIRRVEDTDGAVVFENKDEGVQVIDPQVARTVTDILTGVTNGTAPRAELEDRTIAGKTGTTDNKKDAWFVGFVPQMVAAVWMGDPSNDPQPMYRVGRFAPVYGGTYPAIIWQTFMTRALQGVPPAEFIPPDETLWPPSRYVTDQGRGRYSSSSRRSTTNTTAPPAPPPAPVPAPVAPTPTP